MKTIFSKVYNKNVLLLSASFTIIVFFALRSFDTPLHTSAAPSGIVSFEFAKDTETAKQIIDSWDSNAKTNAGLSLGIDFLFLVTYSIFFSTACFMVAKKYIKRYPKIYTFGVLLAYLLLLAGVFDAIENISLIKLLLGSCDNIYPLIAYYCATTKFSILAFGLIYILLGSIFGLMIKKDNGR